MLLIDYSPTEVVENLESVISEKYALLACNKLMISRLASATNSHRPRSVNSMERLKSTINSRTSRDVSLNPRVSRDIPIYLLRLLSMAN